mmetsp:Transcript_23772/g.54926  ORF Transcript_23772/g.54926 Transcript_23772/m.54926 type:complete len:641 (-) Transcript_23772:153-2075(-)
MGLCLRAESAPESNVLSDKPAQGAAPPQQSMGSARTQAQLKSSASRLQWKVDPATVEGTGFNADEKALDWLNFVLSEGWAHIDKAIKKVLKEDVEPLLNAALPPAVRDVSFSKCSLGDQMPKVQKVSVYKKHRQRHVGIEIDIDFAWECNGELELQLMGKMLSVSIKDIKAFGQLSVVLRPLLDTLPIVGGLQLFMISPPDIRWTMGGIGNVVDAPVISGKVREIVMQEISDALVLPNRTFVHWIYGREREVDITSLQFPRPEGIVRIGAVAAKNLDAMDWSLLGRSTSDPFVTLRVGARTHTTPTINKSLSPEWGEKAWADFFIFNPRQLLNLTVYDADYTGSETIGSLRNVRLFNVLEKGDAWYDIVSEKSDEHVSGQVRIIVEAFELIPFSTAHLKETGFVEEPDRVENSNLEEARACLRNPPKARGPHAAHTAFMQVQVQCLRGLPLDKAAGNVVTLEVEGKTYKTTPSVLHETGQDLVYDAKAQMIDPAAQRLAEYLASEHKCDVERIAHVSGLDSRSLARVLQEMPSFTCSWDHGTNILLKDLKTATVQLSMHSPNKGDKNRYALAKKFEVGALLDQPTLEFEGNLDMVPVDASGNPDESYNRSSNTALDIHVKISLYALRHLDGGQMLDGIDR